MHLMIHTADLSEIAATATMAMLAYAGDLRGTMRRERRG